MQTRHNGAFWCCSAVAICVTRSMTMTAAMLPQGQAVDLASMRSLTQTANALNKNLPMMVDKETELFSASAQPGLFIYNYRVVTFTLTPANAPRAESLLKRNRPSIVNGACTTPDVRDGFLDQGVTLQYAYYDRDKRFIVALEVEADDCEQGN